MRHTGETPSGVTSVADPLAAGGHTSPAGADAGLTGSAERSGRALPPGNGPPSTCALPPGHAAPPAEAGLSG
ncbi:MAG TPA: hypothetical protein VE733_24525, partial [Streptosporangiaceae bacterium]|nr:hypothetical protein [Streptosporangiaceae bacterium]